MLRFLPSRADSSFADFGIPLWQVLEKEGSTVPILMEKALQAIEEKGKMDQFENGAVADLFVQVSPKWESTVFLERTE